VHGPAGVLTVVLYETALGGLALLWLAPLWGVVRPGFFKLAGATVLTCAALAWLAGRGELAAAGPTGRMAALWLGVFAAAVLVWQVLLYARVAAARWAGMAAVLPGLVAGWPLAQLSGRPALGALALLTGALFLGATLDGLVAAALVSAALGGARGSAVDQSLSPLLAFPNLTVYLAVGLVLLVGLMASFIRVLVKGNSIQAATGMFYLAVIMALAAEFAAKVYFFPA
jgi:hypothetical protein